ncbi:MAG: hypothetical protein M3081_11495, partial [Gemmatimonadota bacterium]|nr:hypothetical protein [Gemmatimonadota bacterium]
MRNTRVAFAFALIVSATSAAAQSGTKALTQKDYDQWRSISGVALSHDGKWAVYSLVPQVGDGEVVVRALPSGAEYR